MATIGGRPIPSWALYAGGGVALGGAYLLYKRRKSSQTSASTSGATSTIPTTTYPTGADQQQSSIVPYYLSGGSGTPGSYGIGTLQGSPPLPTPGGPPANVTAQTPDTTGGAATAVLPSIPPLLPVAPPAPPAQPPTQPVAPTPPPAQNNNIPPDLLARITANGEKIIGGLPSPNGGMWWLGSKGGVFAINAPFYGAPAGQSYWGNRTPAAIVPRGSGYSVISSTGETYNYA